LLIVVKKFNYTQLFIKNIFYFLKKRNELKHLSNCRKKNQ